MFASELELVEYSTPFVSEYFKSDSIVTEPKGLFGIPDMIIYNGNIISIEFKLKNWKRALQQAYRYRSFSNEAYVFLDKDYTKTAVENINDFIQFNVGLCSIEEGEMIIYHKPEKRAPYSGDMRMKAKSLFECTGDEQCLI